MWTALRPCEIDRNSWKDVLFDQGMIVARVTINSAEARTGPDVENCYLESMPDDALPVSGHYSWVMEGSGNSLIVSNTVVYSGTNFNIGDPLRLIDANNHPAGGRS